MRKQSVRMLALLMALLFGFASMDVTSYAAEIVPIVSEEAVDDEEKAADSTEPVNVFGESESDMAEGVSDDATTEGKGESTKSETDDVTEDSNSEMDVEAAEAEADVSVEESNKTEELNGAGTVTLVASGATKSNPYPISTILSSLPTDEEAETLDAIDGVLHFTDWSKVGDQEVNGNYRSSDCYFVFTPKVTGNYTIAVVNGYQSWAPYSMDADGNKTYQSATDEFRSDTKYYVHLKNSGYVGGTTTANVYIYVSKPYSDYTFSASATDSEEKAINVKHTITTSTKYEVETAYKSTINLTVTPNSSNPTEDVDYHYSWIKYSDSDSAGTKIGTDSPTVQVTVDSDYIYQCGIYKNSSSSVADSNIAFQPAFNTLKSMKLTSASTGDSVTIESQKTTAYDESTKYTFNDVTLTHKTGDKLIISASDIVTEVENATVTYTWTCDYQEKKGEKLEIDNTTTNKTIVLTVNDGVCEAEVNITVNAVTIKNLTASRNYISGETHYVDAVSKEINGTTYTHRAGYPINVVVAINESDWEKYSNVQVVPSNLKIDGASVEVGGQTRVLSTNKQAYNYNGPSGLQYGQLRFIAACIGYYSLSTGNHEVTCDISLAGTDTSDYSYSVISLGDSKTATGTVTVNEELSPFEDVCISEKKALVDADTKTVENKYFDFYQTNKAATITSVEIYKHLDGTAMNYSSDNKVGSVAIKGTPSYGSTDCSTSYYSSYCYNFGKISVTESSGSEEFHESINVGECINILPAAYYVSALTDITITGELLETQYLDTVITMSDGSKHVAKESVLYDAGNSTIFGDNRGYMDNSKYVVNADSAGDYISVVIYGRKIDGSCVPKFYLDEDCSEDKVIAEYDTSDSNCACVCDTKNEINYITLKKNDTFSKVEDYSFFYYKLPETAFTLESSYTFYESREESSLGYILFKEVVNGYAVEYSDAGIRIRLASAVGAVGTSLSGSFGYHNSKGNYANKEGGDFIIQSDSYGNYIDIPSTNAIYKALDTEAYSADNLEEIILKKSSDEYYYVQLNICWKARTVSNVTIAKAGSSWKLCQVASDSVAKVVKQGTSSADNQVVLSLSDMTEVLNASKGETFRLVTTTPDGETSIENLYFDTSLKTITLNGNGGTYSGASTVDRKNGEIYGTLPVPTRTGYTFLGYSTTKEGAVSINSGTKVNLDTDSYGQTLYAVWRVNSYTICYNPNGGKGKTVKQTSAYTDATEANPLKLKSADEAGFTRAGYTFAGWDIMTTPTEGVTYGKDKLTSTTPLSSEDKVTVNLYAQWTPIKYTVVLHPGVEGPEDKTIEMNYGEYLYLTGREFTQTGKTISGWAESKDAKKAKYKSAVSLSNLTTESTGDKNTINLYALWTTGKYNITYVLGGGKAKNATSYEYDKKDVVINNPTNAGYSFIGWRVAGTALEAMKTASYTDDNNMLVMKSDKYIIPKGMEGDIILTAVWKSNTYTVKIDADGGTNKGNATYSDIEYDALINGGYADYISVNNFSRNGYSLKGFATKKNGNGTKLDAADSDKYILNGLTTKAGSTVTVYPIWKLDKYTITYNANGGTLAKSATGFSVTSKDIVLKNPTRNGWKFAGWSVSGDGLASLQAGKYVAEETTGENTTYKLTAKNKALAYIIPKGTYGGNITLNANWTSLGNYKVTINVGQGKYYGSTTTFYNVTPEGKIGDTTQYILKSDFSGNYVKGKNMKVKSLCTKANGKGVYAKTGTDSSGNECFLLSDLPSVNGEVTLYAIYANATYTISYSNNVGLAMKNPNPSTGTYGKAINLKNPSIAGYTFNYWKSGDSKCATISSTNTYNMAFTAYFTPNNYTITLNPNGATNTKQTISISASYDRAIDLTDFGDSHTDFRETYKRTGYIFKGFSTKTTGKTLDASEVKNLTTKSNGKVSLYPIWEKISTSKISNFTVTPDISNSGDGVSNYVTVCYKQAKGTVARYELEYSYNSNMRSSVTKTQSEYKSNWNFTATEFVTGKTLYFRMREVKVDSYGSLYYGAWSDMKTIKF